MKPITAAPIILLPTTSKEIAFTTFNKIFIRAGLPAKEHKIALKHEQAHIWLRHRARMETRDQKLWNIAADIEIAKEIYSINDTATINSPLSVMKGVITSLSFPNLPKEAQYAEEIYDWLEQNAEKVKNYIMSDDLPPENNENKTENEVKDAKTPEELIDTAREAFDEIEEQNNAEKAVKNKLNEIKNSPPSLGGTMDSILRTRFDRTPSYRRPSRRNSGFFIDKGKITSHQNPLIEIFVDRSGSFTEQKTRKAEIIISNILARYRATVISDVFFFGNNRLDKDKVMHGGNTPYQLIAYHLMSSIPTIAIVITDDDPCEILVVPKQTKILVVPVGAQKTLFAKACGGCEVQSLFD